MMLNRLSNSNVARRYLAMNSILLLDTLWNIPMIIGRQA
jgi:hypothetical protein